MTDALEQQGMESLVQYHLGNAGTDIDLRAQLVLYEVRRATRAHLGARGGEGGGAVPHPSGSYLGPHLLERPAFGGWRHRGSRRWAAGAEKALF